ncbi:hypothetical protein R3P82_14840 [Dietzia maris]|uniref:Double-GTPase 2 domain-containing protein n=1 Tax=Dietzia maris TaxID=37915 RepID=A0AAE4R1A3_9ACTN|nr:hypothetical protein [Dietzia maris]MDV6300383.1 hypothetical protein [Dietzia maris]
MAKSKFEQHIAVFGESGSGKTVMLSSFYGAAQEPAFIKADRSHLVAEMPSQGTKLHSNYLGMKKSATVPPADKFRWDSYAFDLKLQKDPRDGGGTIDALRLVWHDYPGEWFEGRREGARERSRQVESFKALLGSDVALLLIDGQRIIDNQNEEERYLKSVFANFRNTLLAVKDDILEGGKLLVQFPRIWMIALSKADLLPEMDIYAFRDLLIEKAADEIGLLRDVLASFVVAPEALSVGEDFLLLSSGRFDPGAIDLKRQQGLDLILPISALMPFERHVKWTDTLKLPGKVAENLLDHAKLYTTVLMVFAQRLPGPFSKIAALIGPAVLAEAADLAGGRLRSFNKEATAKGNVLAARIMRFKIDLEDAEESASLIRAVV